MRAIAAVAAALLLTACTAIDDHNDADVMFAQKMIPHHEQAVEMSKLAEGRRDFGLGTLAGQIERSQEPEIRTMKGWLRDWGADTHSGEHVMDGMLTGEQMDELERRTSPAYDPAGVENTFDHLWLTLMIEHHEGAITMAEGEIRDGKNHEAIDLAEKIVDGQSAEIDQMETMLYQWEKVPKK
jgi:uncharacterized protein (DUF305 family)